MAEKKNTARKPARTIDEQIADLQAKKEATDRRRAVSLHARFTAFTEQKAKAQERIARIDENIEAVRAEAEELGVVLDEAAEAEAEAAEDTETK